MVPKHRSGKSSADVPEIARTPLRSFFSHVTCHFTGIRRSGGPRPTQGETVVSDMFAYERDPRLTRLETTVVRSGGEDGRPYVVLEDTILYPEGGGQPADRGTIDSIEVCDVQRVSGEVRHFLGPQLVTAPRGGDLITVELAWGRRFDHMQQHTGQHLLTAIAEATCGWAATAFHLGDRISDIVLDTSDVRAEQLVDLEEAVAAEIRAARPITTKQVSSDEYAEMPVRSRGLPSGHAGSVRLVEIDGIDLNTCGGTHLSSTAELEGLKLLGTESVRAGARLFYVAGVRLRRLHAAHHARNAELRSLFGASDDELVAAAAAKLEQLRESQRTLRSIEDDLATECAAGLAQRVEPVLISHWPGRDLSFLQRVAREVSRLAPDRVVLLTAGEGESGAFLIGAGEASRCDVPEVGPQVAEVLGGGGGGSGRFFQGRATALSRLEEAASLLG